MLDRLPTEVVSLIIHDVSTQPSAWRRKALLRKLGLVCKSWRRLVLALAEATLEINRPSVVAAICKWPAERRELVTTLLVGKELHWAVKRSSGFFTDVLNRLLSALPNVEHVYMQNLDYTQAGIACRVAPGSPYQNLRSLSICDSKVKFLPAVESAAFALRRLHVDITQKDRGIQHLLLAARIPHLELLRLSLGSGSLLPQLEPWFLDNLRAIQIDIDEPSMRALSREQADHNIFETVTPTLFSFKHGIGGWPLSADPIVKYIQTNLNDAINYRSAPSDRLAAIFCVTDLESDRHVYPRRCHAFRPMPCAICGRRLQGTTSRGRYADGAPNVKIVHDCPPLYDFVQPAFLEFLAR